MQSTSTNSRRGSRRPHPDPISPHAHPQALLSPTFSLSPSVQQPPHTFPTAFPTPQYDYASQSTPATQPPALLPSNWQRPRARSSYALEPATLAFPEPQLHRATSSRAVSRPPPLPPRTPSKELETAPRIAPALSHRDSVTGPKIQGAKVALRFHLERHCL
jgi:hypothetical protein